MGHTTTSVHLESIKKNISSGYINWGGVMLDDHVPDSQGRPQFKGSVLMFVADTKEEVLKMIEEDEYTKNEVWDKEKIEIYPVSFTFSCKYTTCTFLLYAF